MRWIKASELPNNSVYIFRVIGNIHTARPYVVNEYSRKVCHNELLSIENAFSVRLTELEYLDESTPASIKDEAKALYPYEIDAEHLAYEPAELKEVNDMRDAQRLAHITCARMYTGEIERLKGENEKMRKALERADAEINSLYQENGTWGSAVLQEIREALKITQ